MSPDRYERLYNFGPVGYMILDKTGTILCINLTGAEILESTAKKLIGLPFIVNISKGDRQKFLDHLQLSRERPESITTILKRATRNDAVAWIELVTVRTRLKAVSPSAFQCTFTDITKRKQTADTLTEGLEAKILAGTLALKHSERISREKSAMRSKANQALRESEERFQLMVVSAPDYGVFRLDTEGKVATWNEGARRLYGYRATEIVGRHFSTFYIPEDVHIRKPQGLLKTASLAGHAEDEGWRIRKNRTPFWSHSTITALHDQQGQLGGYLKVTRDITERRQAQEALRSNTKKMNDFFDQAPLGILWVDPKGRIMRINRTACKLLGLKFGERFDRRVKDFSSDKKVFENALKRLASQEVLHDMRVKLRRADGSFTHALIDANGQWESGQMLHSCWFIRDINRRVELEREVLVIAERERQRLGQDLHDDLCQQLTGIEFLCQTLVRELQDKSKDDVARAKEIAGLVRDVNVHAREIAHGLLPMELKTFGLSGALRELALRIKKMFGIDCRFRCRMEVVNLPADAAAHVYRIVQEAVTNALKHGQAKRIIINLTQNAHQTLLAIEDDGIGLPLEPALAKGMGLRGMQHRTAVVGGTLRFQRSRLGGATILCSVNNDHENNKEN